MNEQALRARVAHLQIVVKRLMNTSLSGDFSSAFRGGGLEFSQLRQYTSGDDTRSIDWNSSAKMNKLMVKEFVQEKERTVIIALDVSASLGCSSQSELKQSYAQQMAASLAMIAQNTNDKVGLMLFSDRVLRFIPPRKGRGHSAYLVRQIVTAHKYAQASTDLAGALDRLQPCVYEVLLSLLCPIGLPLINSMLLCYQLLVDSMKQLRYALLIHVKEHCHLLGL